MLSILGISFIYPFNRRPQELVYFELTTIENMPKRGVKRIDLQYKSQGDSHMQGDSQMQGDSKKEDERQITRRIFLVNQGNIVIALSGVCSHLGCLVNFNRLKGVFICPCHGGTYDISGKVISGPPNRPLKQMPLEIRDGKVFIGLVV